MDVGRKRRYSNQDKLTSSSKKINTIFDLSTLNLMANYIISDNEYIKRSQLLNMRNLFESIDLDLYKNDPEKMNRIIFIKKGIEGRLEKGIDNIDLLIKYINGGFTEKDLVDINNFTELSRTEIDIVNDNISSCLNFNFVDSNANSMIELLTNFVTSDYQNKSSMLDSIESCVDEFKDAFRKNKSDSSTEMSFCLRDGIMEDRIRETHKIVSNPSRFLKTGMRGFNELLGGGFESTRSYLLLGLAGGGKSFTLLNLAYQIKKYNKNYKTKDPTKIPAIVILTMENSVVETVTRLFSIASTNSDHEFRNHTVDEIIDIMRTEGELYLSDDSPIDIIIKFKPDRSVDTSYLYTLTEDLEDEGYEVICMIQDHIKRIRSVYNYPDLRQELGAVANEMKAFAQIKDLVIITDSHFNREGAKTIDDAKIKNESDLIRKLGRGNVGESFLMIDNFDCVYGIEKEYDSNGVLYMGFAKFKSRIKTNRDSFYQPLTPDNDIRLMEDVDLDIPLLRDSLRSQQPKVFNNGVNRYNTSLQSIELKKDDDADNIFAAKAINEMNIKDIIRESNTINKMDDSLSFFNTRFKPYSVPEKRLGLIPMNQYREGV